MQTEKIRFAYSSVQLRNCNSGTCFDDSVSSLRQVEQPCNSARKTMLLSGQYSTTCTSKKPFVYTCDPVITFLSATFSIESTSHQTFFRPFSSPLHLPTTPSPRSGPAAWLDTATWLTPNMYVGIRLEQKPHHQQLGVLTLNFHLNSLVHLRNHLR